MSDPAPLTDAQRKRLSTEVIAAPDAEAHVVRRIVNAWDCCGTCAGGVYASAVRSAVEQERAARLALVAKIEALADELAERLSTVRVAERIRALPTADDTEATS